MDKPMRPAVVMVSDEDAALVVCSKSGDLTAFEQLISRYDRKLYRIAYHIVRNADDAKDVVQDTFIKVFQNIGRFQAQSRFSTWIYRIVVNQSLTVLRKRTRKAETVESFSAENEEEHGLPFDLSEWRLNPEEEYRQTELRQLLTRLLNDLRPALRVVFIMHDIEGLTLREVAEALSLTIAAVKTRSQRARLHLREQLTVHFKHDIEGMWADQQRRSAREAVAAFA